MRVVSVDWLSIYCHASFCVSNGAYQFVACEQGSRQFKRVYNVYDIIDNELYAVVQSEPYSKIIPKNAVIVKVANRYLYRKDWNSRIMYFLSMCHFVPQSISRIDICADFNQFDNNLTVPSFFRKFLDNVYLKNGRAEYQIQGEQKACHEISYLRFGKHDSDVSVYLYNKSKELREVSSKPYISELWQIQGLDTTRDVWRLEVSMKTTQSRFVIKQTGETFRLDLDFMKTQGIIENVYNCVVLKYFQFKRNNLTKNKSRMQTVELFKSMKTTMEIYTPTNEACAGRMDKILIRKLANAMTELRLETEEFPPAIMETLFTYIEQKGLLEWFRLKVEPEVKQFKDR